MGLGLGCGLGVGFVGLGAGFLPGGFGLGLPVACCTVGAVFGALCTTMVQLLLPNIRRVASVTSRIEGIMTMVANLLKWRGEHNPGAARMVDAVIQDRVDEARMARGG